MVQTKDWYKLSIRDLGQLSKIVWKDWSRMHEPLSNSALSHKTVVYKNQIHRFNFIYGPK